MCSKSEAAVITLAFFEKLLEMDKVRQSRISYVDVLDAFAKLPKATLRFIISVRSSVCLSLRLHGTTRLPLDGFPLIWYLSIFRKSIEKIQL
jgi:hypothetical protein